MIPLAILGLAAILSTLALNMVAGWDLKAAEACPGTEDFCNGVWWTLYVRLPAGVPVLRADAGNAGPVVVESHRKSLKNLTSRR